MNTRPDKSLLENNASLLDMSPMHVNKLASILKTSWLQVLQNLSAIRTGWVGGYNFYRLFEISIKKRLFCVKKDLIEWGNNRPL